MWSTGTRPRGALPLDRGHHVMITALHRKERPASSTSITQ
jgi:hypothetical protein